MKKNTEKTISEFLRRFELFGNRPAFQLGQLTISYSQLLHDIEILAGRCVHANLHKGSIAILLLPNGYEFALCFFALAFLGVVVVPLNPNIGEELISIVLCCRPAVVFTAAANFVKVNHLIVKTNVNCELIEIHPYDESKNSIKSRKIIFKAIEKEKPEDDACILFTSGTSGKQKGVVLTQNGLIQSIMALSEYLPVDAQDRFLGIVPMFHGYGLTFNLLLPLWLGAYVSVFESFHPKTILQYCKTFQPTVIVGTPSIYRILAKLTSGNRTYYCQTRCCLAGGSALSLSDACEFTQKTGLNLYNCYGSTETGTIAIKVFDENDCESAGPPMPAVKVKIIREQASDQKTGEVGEIVVSSPWLMKGYFKEAAETKRVLNNNWYYTGDLGKKDKNGHLVLYGRNNDMIKTKGFRVYPKEIESVIMQHPQVIDVVVFGVENASKGEEIFAAVEFKASRQTQLQKELKSFCRQRLLEYKIPRQIFCFPSFPKLANGKINRNEIKQSVLNMLQQSGVSHKTKNANVYLYQD